MHGYMKLHCISLHYLVVPFLTLHAYKPYLPLPYHTYMHENRQTGRHKHFFHTTHASCTSFTLYTTFTSWPTHPACTAYNHYIH